METGELFHRLDGVVVEDGTGRPDQVKGFHASFAPLYQSEPAGLHAACKYSAPVPLIASYCKAAHKLPRYIVHSKLGSGNGRHNG